MTDAKPYPKSAQLARGERRYRRKIASPKQWQAIIAAKYDRCRLCLLWNHEGGALPNVQLHHTVSREDHGDDVADNIVPLCRYHHDLLTRRDPDTATFFCARLSDAEYAYMIERGGEDYPERAYGIRYSR